MRGQTRVAVARAGHVAAQHLHAARAGPRGRRPAAPAGWTCRRRPGPIRPTMRPAGKSEVDAVERHGLAVAQATTPARAARPVLPRSRRGACRHCGTLIASSGGQGAWASSLTQATPGRPVLTSLQVLLQQFAVDLRLDPEHQLLALAGGLHGLGRELGGAGDEGHLRPESRYCGAASSTMRTSLPSATRPATVSGRKKVM